MTIGGAWLAILTAVLVLGGTVGALWAFRKGGSDQTIKEQALLIEAQAKRITFLEGRVSTLERQSEALVETLATRVAEQVAERVVDRVVSAIHERLPAVVRRTRA